MALYTVRAQGSGRDLDAGVAREISLAQAFGRRAVRERLPGGLGYYRVCDNQGRVVASGVRIKEPAGALVWKEWIE